MTGDESIDHTSWTKAVIVNYCWFYLSGLEIKEKLRCERGFALVIGLRSASQANRDRQTKLIVTIPGVTNYHVHVLTIPHTFNAQHYKELNSKMR